MKSHYLPSLVIAASLLSGCSPHPGAGYWSAQNSEGTVSDAEFARLHVSYEGRTNIFAQHQAVEEDSDATALRRCFWHGVDAQRIELQCVLASNTEVEETLMLQVAADRNHAQLLRGGKAIASFVRQVK